jgi:chaperonin GroEL
MSKEMRFEDDARKAIFEGVRKLSHAVKSTLGPTGRNVLIKRQGFPPIITKDGVTVAKEVDLEDPYEDLGAELVREVASKTASAAGDGTTTATVLAEAILMEGAKQLAVKVNAIDLKRGIDKAVSVVSSYLDRVAIPINTREEMLNVATISANGDTEIGDMVAGLVDEIGSEGVATIEKSGSEHTFVEKVDGLQLSGGWTSPYFATTDDQTKAVWDDAMILLYNGRISSAKDIALGNANGFLSRVVTSNSPLIIVAEAVEGEALHLLVLNRVQQKCKFLSVKMPFTTNQSELLQDLAVLTGGKVFSKETGHKQLHKIDLNDLGRVERVVASSDKTIFLGGKGNPDEISARVEDIKNKIEEADTDAEKRKLKERAAKLSSGIAVIKVGGASEVEYKEKHDRVEDALYATQAAIELGIVPGGGVALARAALDVDKMISKMENDDQRKGAQIISRALSAPLRQIATNAGQPGDVVLEKVVTKKDNQFGYDARGNRYANLVDAGIIDPVKVAKSAIQNAASVSGLMLTTDVVLIEKKLEPNKG